MQVSTRVWQIFDPYVLLILRRYVGETDRHTDGVAIPTSNFGIMTSKVI